MRAIFNKYLSWLLIVALVLTMFPTAASKAKAEESLGTPKGYVTLTVEKFTLGQGYYLEPIRLPFYEGDNGAALLTRALGEDNIKHTGTIDNAFYLSKVKDPTSETDIPQYIVDQVTAAGASIGEKKDTDWLGEFDYTYMSGWMYAVNNVPPSVGVSQYTPEDGDVIRTQFTVFGYGMDLGDSDWSPGYIKVANKDELTELVGKFNGSPDKSELLANAAIHLDYENAYAVLENMESTQESVDQALSDLDTDLKKDVLRPVLAVQGLADQSVVTSRQLNFQVGVTDNVSSGIIPTVTLNGQTLTGTGGAYTASLSDGANTVSISATDGAGNESRQTFSVFYNILQVAKDQLNQHLAYILRTVPNPTFGTAGGEWSVLTLARAGYEVPDSYYSTYYNNAINQVKTLMTQNSGVLDKSKSTEHSRLIVGLASIAKDPHLFAGYDITKALSDFDYDVKQGINGPTWALIALDTNHFDVPVADSGITQATRENLINYILQNEVKKGTANAGGWGFGTADVDLTSMVLQALTPYASEPLVNAAIDRALNWLSKTQNAKTGDFYSNAESNAQVVTALSGLNIDATKDSRFIKNGISVLDAMLAYALPSGGFKHTLTGGVNGMATDQGTYALVAFKRMTNAQNRLYDMTDAREAIISPPDGSHPVIDIPQADRDYSIPIYPYDQYKQYTINIPDEVPLKVSLNTTANSSLPEIKAIKGSVSVHIPQGTQILSGDAGAVELLTGSDAASASLRDKVSTLIPAGSKLDSVDKAIVMGGSASVDFSQYVKITFAGMKGKNAAFIQNGTIAAIQKFADDAAGSVSGKAEYAYDEGNDLIVQTKHFTDFVAYATSAVNGTGGGGTAPTAHVTLSIDKQTINKGYVISPKSVTLQPGDTVWTVLQRELNAGGITFKYEWNTQYNSVYVQSIAGDGEFDNDSNGSGWMYNVNGVYPNYGASLYVLKAGDSIQWRYTMNLGADLGQSPEEWCGSSEVRSTDAAGCPATGGGGDGAANGNATLLKVPDDIQKDYALTISKDMRDKGIAIEIPDVKPKVILDVTAVKDGMPAITAMKGNLSLTIDKDTQLKTGSGNIELLTQLDTSDSALLKLIQAGQRDGDSFKTLNYAFAMGESDQSILFDRPVTLAIKGGKGQQAGFIENGVFTPIVIYDSEAKGAEATKGNSKITYAFVSGGDLVIKTNHFTSFVAYAVDSGGSTGGAAGGVNLSKKYADAGLIASWAYDAVGAASEKGFMQGNGGKFNPKAAVTRAEFAKLMVGMLGLRTSTGKPSAFKDVPQDSWFAPYVNAAYGAGIIQGAEGLFNPNASITREQMAAMIVRALALKASAPKTPLQDADRVSAWAKADVQTVVALNLMQGADNLFLPGEAVTREMAAVVAMRAYGYREQNRS